MGRRDSGLWAAAGLAVALLGGAGPALLPTPAPTAVASGDSRLAEMASPSPYRGLVYAGLALGRDGTACEGVFEARNGTGASLGCSHGPDPAPPGVDVRRGRSDEALAADLWAGEGTSGGGEVGCIGDGTTGSRVQALYAVPAGRTDRSATVVPTIRSRYAPGIDWQFNQSAAETGGEAHVVFVTEADPGGTGCRLAVPVVHLSAAADNSFSNTVSELKALGFDRPDRKYLVWMDAAVLCGVGTVYNDSRPGLENLNNGFAPMFARVDTACWGYAEGHELMHTLGAVQRGAPNATDAGHCRDEPDDMCYDDDGDGPTTMVNACGDRSDALFDCNHDDYFYAGVPPVQNWLATHWNTFNSNWLWRGPLPAVAVVPPPTGPGGGGPASTSSTTTTLPPATGTGSPDGGGGPGRGAGGNGTNPPTGYWMLTADGQVHPFGAAAFHGRTDPLPAGVRAVDLEPTPSGAGYWVLDEFGLVWAHGDAPYWGSVSSSRLDPGERAVSLSATPSGDGYWVFTTRGRAVAFGDAGFFGDASALPLNRPVTGSVATPTGRGYYLFASDGGIFTFGDARFHGSTGGLRLNRPVVAMAVAPAGGGYWLVASDGGLFAFGAAPFYGSMGAVRLNRPVSAVVPGPAGYLMVGEDGGAFSFGDVDFFGSLGANPPSSPVVSVALRT